jgi:flagellar hook protein FlgE
MSLISSLYTGTTGLESNSQDLSIIGDNIANANTIGFKETRAVFEDQLSQTLLGSASNGQIGLGAHLLAAQRIFTQGALTTTGNNTDLALQGGGLFVVRGTHDGVLANFYTRDGQFSIDRNGFMVNQEGLRLQGYQADVAGNISGTVGDLDVAGAAAQPHATANVVFKANLDAGATVGAAFNPATPSTTSNFSTSVTIYDSLGVAHQTSVYFRKSGPNAWEWHALTDGSGITGGTAGTPVEIAGGTMAFNSSGGLQSFTQAGTFNPANATNPQPVTFNLGDPASVAGGTGFAGITQFASTSAISFASQDGYSTGQLAGLTVSSDGTITGALTNGQARTLGKVAVAQFAAPDRLQREGGNLMLETFDSGQPSVGVAGTGGRGSVVSGSLEQSNVDLATEFVRMISAQRDFEANSKTITTADQLLTELIQIKR